MIRQTTFVDLDVACRHVVYSYLNPRLRFVFPEDPRERLAVRVDGVACAILEGVAKEVLANRGLPEPRELSVDERVDAHFWGMERYFTHVNHFVFSYFPQIIPSLIPSPSALIHCVEVSKWCEQVEAVARQHLFSSVQIFLATSQKISVQPDAIQTWLEVGVKPHTEIFEELCLRGSDQTIFHYLPLFFQTGVRGSDLTQKGNAVFRALLRNPAIQQWQGYFDFLHRQGLEITPAAKLMAILKDATQASKCFFLNLTRIDLVDLKKPLNIACLEKVFSTLEPNLVEVTVWELAGLLREAGMRKLGLDLLEQANPAFALLLNDYCTSSSSTAKATASSGSSGMPALEQDQKGQGNSNSMSSSTATATSNSSGMPAALQRHAGQKRKALAPTWGSTATSGSSGMPALAPNQDWNRGEALVPAEGPTKSVESRVKEAWDFLKKSEVTHFSHEVVQLAADALERAPPEIQDQWYAQVFALQEELERLDKAFSSAASKKK